MSLNLDFLSELQWPQLSFVFDWKVLLAYAFGILLLYAMARLLLFPLKLTLRLLGNAAGGILLVALFNFIGGYFGFHLPINPITALVAGFLGVPGVALLVGLQYLVLP